MSAASSSPRSILWLNQLDPGHPWAGGAERHIHEVGRRLVAAGHRVTVVAERFGELPAEEWRAGMRILRPVRRGFLHAWVVANAGRLVRQLSVDVVVGDLSKIVPWGHRSLGGRPLVSVVRHFNGRTLFTEAPFPAAPVLWAVERATPAFLRSADLITESAATETILAGLGATPSRISRIPPGVDSSVFSPDPSDRSGSPLVVYVGRIKQYKRVDLAVRAFARVLAHRPDAEFHIAGGGSDHDRIVALVRELGLTRSIRFLGLLPTDEIVRLYRRAWVHVQPSYAEGWGLTALESMACGTPVVAFATGSLPETVGPLCADLLAEEGRLDSLTEALERGLARPESSDPLAAARLAEYARRFTWEATAERYAAVLDRVVRRHARPTPSPVTDRLRRPSRARGLAPGDGSDRATDHAEPG
ncbi:MAG TPA: glycosyltransferase family 4 protein [Thermoplasmata archaeon]|nr:glycosyltransferase family 4 protein [Thermoplasmata archaeon]